MSEPTSLPLELIDGEGFSWDIQPTGAIKDGSNNAYDGAFNLSGATSTSSNPFGYFGTGNTATEDSGREVVIGSAVMGDGYGRPTSITATRKIYVSPTDGFVRYLEIFKNTGSSHASYSASISSNLGSDSRTAIIQTSSGDQLFTKADNWIITDDTNPSGSPSSINSPTLLHVFGGPGGYGPSWANAQTGSDYLSTGGWGGLEFAPGETKIIMHFAAQSADQAAALTKAQQLTALGMNALTGMSLEEQQSVINFDLGINNVLPPDLEVVPMALSGVNPGQTLDVTWQVKNNSRGTAYGRRYTKIYLSSNQTLENTDQRLSPSNVFVENLAGGSQQSLTQQITIPNTINPNIPQYLLFVVEDTNSTDSNLSNNIVAVSLPIGNSDLVPVAPATISPLIVGQQTSVAWSVQNQSGGPTSQSSWRDTVYWSEDATLDATDTLLTSNWHYQSLGGLAAGASYTVPSSFQTPIAAIDRDYYLIFKTDDGLNGTSQQVESNEYNNTLAVRVRMEAPDLAVTDIAVSDQPIHAGQMLNVQWTVKNQGNRATPRPWKDQIYLLNTDTGVQQLLGEFDSPTSLSLAANETLPVRQQSVKLPIDLNGNYRVVVKTGVGLEGRDSNAANNTLIDDRILQIGAAIRPNLQVSSVTAPTASLFSGQETTVEWTVKNAGTGATSASFWYDSVWLSTKDTWDNTAVYLGKTTNAAYLNANESYSNRLTVRLPEGLDGTNYRFLVYTDGPDSGRSANSRVDEGIAAHEQDNVGASAVSRITLTPPPDLRPIDIIAPSQAFAGQAMTLRWTVKNEGVGDTKLGASWLDSLYISEDETIGNADDKLLAQRVYMPQHVIQDPTGQTQQQIVSLAAGEQYTAVWDVTLPVDASGTRYFYVTTNSNNGVQEFANTVNNTSELAETNVTLVSPDLTVAAVDVLSANSVAGHSLSVKYRVKNDGLITTPIAAWTDAFYLSEDATFSPDTDILLSKVSHLGALEIEGPRKFYESTAAVSLPDNLSSGNYRLFVVTDSENKVFELDNVNNHFDAGWITVASQPADLKVSSVVVQSSLEAGKAAQITWTVSNQGKGSTPIAAWTDKIYASTAATLSEGQPVLLGTFSHRGALERGGSYSETALITIPFELQGSYNLFVVTDADDKIAEASNEGNNVALKPINIDRQTPDLYISDVTAISGDATGRPLTVNWTVHNQGVGRTNSMVWSDGVYLSRDTTLSQDDRLLGRVSHSGALDSFGSYLGSSTFEVPVDWAGDFYVIVRADDLASDSHIGQVIEGAIGETNNSQATQLPLTFTLGSVPNLVVESVNAPTAGISSQAIEVTWTVRNTGAAVNSTSWYDAVYLSLDGNLDLDLDIYLGARYHEGGLGDNQAYTTTDSFILPRGLSGAFYTFVVADGANRIYERGIEADNQNYDRQAVQVSLPSPAELVAGNISITAPATAITGQTATISYSVTNQGPNVARGSWQDAVYLSVDDQWDINDILLGQVLHTGNVASGGSYSETLTATLPGALPGDYKVIVRSDIRNVIPEADETRNNTSVSTSHLSLGMPQLALNSFDDGVLFQGQSVYYRLDVPEGETMRLTFDSQSNDAMNELYVRYGAVPTQAEFDFGFEQISADPSITVPLTQAGTYYVMARATTVPTWINDVPGENGSTRSGYGQGYTLTAEMIDFGISSISQSVGDRSGKITLQISGAKFTPGMQAMLEAEDGSAIVASDLWLEDSTDVLVTFDLTTATLGTYDLKLIQNLQEVRYQWAADGSLDTTITPKVNTSVLNDQFTVIDARPNDVFISITATPVVRRFNNYDILVSYTNRGTHDVAAPVIVVDVDPDVRLRNVQDADGFDQYGSMTLLGISNEGPAGILRPGETGVIRLQAQAGDSGEINARVRPMVDDGSSINYSDFISYLGGDVSEPSWAAAVASLQDQFGNSWTSFGEGLAEQATKLSLLNNYTHSVTNLWTKIARETWAKSVLNDSSIEDVSNGFQSFTNVPEGSSFGTRFTGSMLIPNPELGATTELSVKENSIRKAAVAMVEKFGAYDAAFALLQFIGQIGEETPPFGITDPTIQRSLYEADLRRKLPDEIEKSVLDWSTNKLHQLQGKNEDGSDTNDMFFGVFKDFTPRYPHNSLYSVNFFDQYSSVSKDVLKSFDYVEKVHLNGFVTEHFKNYVEDNLKQLGLGSNDWSNHSDRFIDLKDISKGFNGFAFYKVPDVVNYDRYFENASSSNLALMLGNTGRDDQRIRINRINLSQDPSLGPNVINYAIDFDLFFWDSTTFELDNGIQNLAFEALTSLTGEGSDLPKITDIAVALGFARPLQQHGWAEPRVHVIQVHDVIEGTLFNPDDSPLPTPPSPPLPPTPPISPPSAPIDSNQDLIALLGLPHFPWASAITRIVGSADPNDILGPQGFGVENWISAANPLSYTIRFENDPVRATAPAQVVRITQKLDDDLDFRTFRVGDFGFGDVVIDVPDNRAFYQTRLDLTATKGIYLDVVAGVDISAGEAFWQFTSIDPATGIEPINPLLGFLPPNLVSSEGQGFAEYSIRSKATISNGAVIDAQARIIFDTEEPIDTPAIFNTIDTGTPTSTVNPLSATTNATDFLVNWSGGDNAGGSALANYTLYVSKDGAAFSPWLENTTLTEATFKGEAGHTYAFYSQARDNAGNLEAAPTTAQAVTAISNTVGRPKVDFNGDGQADILWRHYGSGDNRVWFMDGTNFSALSPIEPLIADTNWVIQAADDFTGDGKTDILWRSYTDGYPGIWLMDGVTLQSSTLLYHVPDLNWQIQGTGDFDGDGQTDILWRDYGTGANAFWSMNDTVYSAGILFDQWVGDVSWQLQGAGDFNGDGRDDLLWRHYLTGDNVVWLMNGTAISTGMGIGFDALTDLNWEMQGTDDFNRDGKVDILWRNYATGENKVWLMDHITAPLDAGKSAILGEIELPTVTDTNWRMAGPTRWGSSLVGTGNGSLGTDTSPIVAMGTSGGDILSGGAGNDTLEGGAGDDVLIGNAGNDTYGVDSLNDSVVEAADAGIDTVQSSVSWVLGDHVENLTLMGTEAINGTGNALNNAITGNATNNWLFGSGGSDTIDGGAGDDWLEGGEGTDFLLGGAGNDTLVGGIGNDELTGGVGVDRFVLNAPNQGIVKITDFTAAEDVLQVSATVFGGGLVAGTALSSEQLLVGAGVSAPTSADQRFIYNSSTGALFFDTDGNQSASATVQVALLINKPLSNSSQILVVG